LEKIAKPNPSRIASADWSFSVTPYSIDLSFGDTAVPGNLGTAFALLTPIPARHQRSERMVSE
jgi:hypothetical protein